MSLIEVRPFLRSDREQLTALVNAHIAAVIPGIAVSVNTVMSQLEREPNGKRRLSQRGRDPVARLRASSRRGW